MNLGLHRGEAGHPAPPLGTCPKTRVRSGEPVPMLPAALDLEFSGLGRVEAQLVPLTEGAGEAAPCAIPKGGSPVVSTEEERIRRFTLADMAEWGAWLIGRLREKWPTISDGNFLGKIHAGTPATTSCSSATTLRSFSPW